LSPPNTRERQSKNNIYSLEKRVTQLFSKFGMTHVYSAKSDQFMLLLRNLIGLFMITLWLGCSKNDNFSGGHPMPWLVRLDIAGKEIEFTYPLTSYSNYLIRLKGID